MQKNPLISLMNPKSIAIVGANNNPVKMGTMHALSITKDGYKGKFYPIHPKEEEVIGLRAYKSVSDLAEAPDLALIVVPSEHLPSLMEDFGKKGTKNAIIITAGFRETGSEGIKQEQLINDIANKYNMRFIGPNCMGVINTQINLNTTVMKLDPNPGMLGLISQSGTYVTQSLSYLEERGIRFSKAVSVGNEANINITDVLEYLGEDESTKAISLYIEGLKDIPRFLETARKITPHKPIIAQYIGGSEAGARSGMSHTGALAGPDHLYEGLFKQAGIIRVHSVEELYGLGWALATQPPLKGNRIGIITNSGGPGSAIADICEQGSLKIPPLSKEVQEKLKPIIPPHAPCSNPVDITFAMDASLLIQKLPEIIMESGEVDGIVLHGAMSSGFIKWIYPHIQEMISNTPVETLIEGLKMQTEEPFQYPFKYGIPLTISSWFNNKDNYTKSYQENNVPTYDTPEKAAKAMTTLYKYKKVKEREPYSKAEIPEPSKEAIEIINTAKKAGLRAIDEHSAKKLLNCYGIPVSKENIATTKEEAVNIAQEIGFPVVLKVSDPEIMHKTEQGLVFLDLKDSDEVESSFNAVQKSVGKKVPVLISEMVQGERELLAGIVQEPGFGPCVVFGLGGVFTEAFDDTTFRLAPVSIHEAEEMIEDIRTQKMLNEFRGMPPVNKEKISELICRLSLITVLHPEIKEIDLNPIIIRGSEPVIVDALIVL